MLFCARNLAVQRHPHLLDSGTGHKTCKEPSLVSYPFIVQSSDMASQKHRKLSSLNPASENGSRIHMCPPRCREQSSSSDLRMNTHLPRMDKIVLCPRASFIPTGAGFCPPTVPPWLVGRRVSFYVVPAKEQWNHKRMSTSARSPLTLYGGYLCFLESGYFAADWFDPGPPTTNTTRT